MKNKTFLFVFVISIMTISLFAVNAQTVKLNSVKQETRLLRATENDCQIQYKFSDLEVGITETKGGSFSTVNITGYTNSTRIGEPQLPLLRKLLYVPFNSEINVSILDSHFNDYTDKELGIQHKILPAQPTVSKSDDPELIPFEYVTKAYQQDKYSDTPIISITEIGIMRGVRIVAIDFEPIKYNPMQNTFRIYDDVKVQVDFIGGNLALSHDILERTASYEFNKLYEKTIFNWPENDRDSIVRYPTGYIILAPSTFNATLESFITWKKQQGYIVTLKNIGSGAGEVANTTTAIKAYLQNLWDTATGENPAPTYLLIVGDTGQVVANTGATGSHPTDLTYVRLSGTDYVPEMYYGRFSATTTTELQNIIDKTLLFEKTTMPSTAYLGETVLIAGADATYAPTHGNGQINYGSTYYFNGTNGITSYNYLYPASASSDAQIIADVNAGVGIVNYTAHGSETGWADPTFSNSTVASMTNTNEYPLMIGNCCLTNKFDYSSCFGETLIRAQNKGAVAYIGGTNSTYWDEDYWWGVGAKGTATGTAPAYSASALGVYDGMFHTHSEAVSDWCQTTGDMIYMGNLAVTQGVSSRINYYWEIYSIMGDPSLYPYMGVPTVHSVTHPSEILIGATSITINATPQSRVAVTQNGVLYGTGIVGVTGSLTLTITPFSTVGTADIVVTSQNKKTYISTIDIIPNSGPYVTLDNWSYTDSNNNVPEYGETGYINATFKNVGSVTATGINCTLSTLSSGIVISDNTETIASLAAGASITVNNAFSFNIANNVADQSEAVFDLAMVSSPDTWDSEFNLTINAPALSFGNVSISDPTGNNNGMLDPGETAEISIDLLNLGHAESAAGNATLICTTTGITVNDGADNFTAISASGSANLSFNISASAGMSIGDIASLEFAATAGSYNVNKSENITVGIILEDFETGNFNHFPWTFSGNANWVIDNTNSHGGTYSAKSGTISDSQTSTMQTIRVLTSGGNLSFWYKVSSESGYDYLKFYIDGVQQNTPGWSGTVNWTQATYALASGTRTLTWTYYKDINTSTGSDCAWIDDIIFPASTAPSIYNPPQNLTAVTGNGFVNLSWQLPVSGTPTGYKIYKNSNLLTTVTALSYNDTDVVNGVTYSYYLKAVYSGGESDPTDIVEATPSINTIITIGAGTTTSQGLPIEPYYGYTYSQSIYLQTGINFTGSISKISWYYNGNSAWTDAVKIYMGHTSITSFASTSSWLPLSGLTLVYDGNLATTTTAGWIELTLDTPFDYNNTQNLVIAIDENTTGYHLSADEFYCSSVTGNRSILFYSDSINPDPASPPTTGTYLYTRAYIPNAKLNFTPVLTDPVIDFTPANIDFGNVFIGNSPSQSFTLSNIGGGILTGQITTPTGYTVFASRTNRYIETARSSFTIRNVLDYSITTGQSQEYSLVFTPALAQSYNSNVVITSNDISNPSVNLAVTGIGVTPVFNAPASLIATASHAAVSLSWTPPIGSSGTLDGYKVYRDDVLITPTPITNSYYNDTGLTNGVTYHYYTKAVYSSPSGESANSNTVNAIPVALAPQNLGYVASHSSVELSWQAPNYGTPASYKIYRNSVFLISVTTLTYIDTSVTNGTSYPYYVTAEYSGPTYESAATNTINATPMALPPQNLIGNGGNTSVSLSWQPPDAGTPAFYRILRNSVYIKNLTATAFIDSNLVNGTTYNYNVTAMYINPTTESALSNTAIVTPNENTEHTIAYGTIVGQGLPMEPYQGYTYSQSIYLQSEINQSNKSINRLYWYYGGGTEFTDAIKIYMGHTDLSAYPSNSSWIPLSNLTMVYDGNITTTPTPDWIEILLETPFVYNNIQNLVIAVDENTSTRHTDTDEFFCQEVSADRSIVFYSLFTNTDPASPPTTGTNLFARNTVPNLKLSLINSSAPLIGFTPEFLNFGPVILGDTLNYVLTIQNISGEALTGTISTPTGYSIAPVSRQNESRNSLGFSLSAGQSLQYNVSLTPLVVQNYNGVVSVVCDDASNSTYNASVTGSGYVPPTAQLNLTELELTLSSEETQSLEFTICNTGSQDLLFDLEIDGSPDWLSCVPMSGTVQNSICFRISVDFDATGQDTGSYYASIIVNSNDPDFPRQEIEVTLNVYQVNHAPTINLPDSFSFNKNESLIQNFEPYINDSDGDPIFLSYLPSRNVNVSVDNHEVTFTATPNWYGSQVYTFTVDDGQATASDSVTIIVLPTDMPTWEPVVYPSNPATVYGVITIDGIPVTTEDEISAFVGSECRGTGTIIIDNGQAYTTMLVNLDSSGEGAIFKVYDSSADIVYSTQTPLNMAYGQVYGEITPHPISFSSLVFIEAPIVTIHKVTEGIRLSWDAVPDATQYYVYSSVSYDSGFTMIATVTATEYIDTSLDPACFYKVVASDGITLRGGAK